MVACWLDAVGRFRSRSFKGKMRVRNKQKGPSSPPRPVPVRKPEVKRHREIQDQVKHAYEICMPENLSALLTSKYLMPTLSPQEFITIF